VLALQQYRGPQESARVPEPERHQVGRHCGQVRAGRREQGPCRTLQLALAQSRRCGDAIAVVASSVVVGVVAAAATEQRRRMSAPSRRRHQLYKIASKNRIPITTELLVKLGLSANLVAVRKMLNRDVHAGILTAIATWPRTYKLAQENVTLCSAASSSRPRRTSTVQKRSRIRAQIPSQGRSFTPNNSNSSLICCTAPEDRIAHVFNTDGRTNNKNNNNNIVVEEQEDQHQYKTAQRVKRHYHKKRRDLCRKFYDEVVRNIAARVTDALNAGLLFEAHDLSFASQTTKIRDSSTAAASLNARRHQQNGSKKTKKGGRFFVDGSVMVKDGSIEVNHKFYPKSGYMQLQPRLSTSPIVITKTSLEEFAHEIRAALPFEEEDSSPDIDSWFVTLADVHIPDLDITDQQHEGWVKALEAVPLIRKLKGVIMHAKLHAYVKKYSGRTWLRVELMKERPRCNLSTFTTSYLQEVICYKFEQALSALSSSSSSSSSSFSRSCQHL
jgi:hypothetical protein